MIGRSNSAVSSVKTRLWNKPWGGATMLLAPDRILVAVVRAHERFYAPLLANVPGRKCPPERLVLPLARAASTPSVLA